MNQGKRRASREMRRAAKEAERRLADEGWSITLYVRTNGCDLKGDGSERFPFRTLEHAQDLARDVLATRNDVTLRFDITGCSAP